MNFTKLIQQFTTKLTSTSPAVLTGIAVAGLVATVVLAVKATPKALLLIEEKELEKEAYLTPKEMVVTAWKEYVPAVVMGGVTIACVIGANTIHARRTAALAGLYSLTEKTLKEYRSKVVEIAGPKQMRIIQDDIAKDKIIANPVNLENVLITGHGTTLCYDAMSGRYFRSDRESINRALNKLARDMLSETTISLNQVYSELDIPQTKLGEIAGWHIDDGQLEPHFSSHLTVNGDPCLVMDFVEEPRYNLNWM